MAVDQVGDGFVGDFRNRFWNVLGVRRWCVNHDNSGGVDHKHRLVPVVGNHVETLAEILNTVAFGWINRGSFGGLRYWKMLADTHAQWCQSGHVRIRFSRLAWDVLVRACPCRGNRGKGFER